MLYPGDIEKLLAVPNAKEGAIYVGHLIREFIELHVFSGEPKVHSIEGQRVEEVAQQIYPLVVDCIDWSECLHQDKLRMQEKREKKYGTG